MKTILITGGIGYVGRELVKLACSQPNVKVHVIDNLSCGEHRLTSLKDCKFTLHRVDITDGVATAAAVKEISPDITFHLAAIHYIPLCESDPANAVNVNVNGTVSVASAIPLGSKFVFASSAAVYSPSDIAHEEDTSDVLPMDIYGWSKLHGEHYVNYLHDTGRLNGINVRLFNVVGSGETNPHLAPAIIEQLSDGVSSIKLGNLFPGRDYINVADVAEGFWRLANAQSELPPKAVVCNLGTGQSYEVGEMVNLIAQAADISINIEQDTARIRKVDRPMLLASTTKLGQLTQWTPGIALSESMEQAWATRQEDRLD